MPDVVLDLFTSVDSVISVVHIIVEIYVKIVVKICVNDVASFHHRNPRFLITVAIRGYPGQKYQWVGYFPIWWIIFKLE